MIKTIKNNNLSNENQKMKTEIVTDIMNLNKLPKSLISFKK